MKAFRLFASLVVGIVLVLASQSGMAQASGIVTNDSSLAPAEVSPARTVVQLHLVYTIGVSNWSAKEIADAYSRVELAVNFWNKQSIPVQFQIAELSSAALGFDTMNIEQSAYLADAQPNVPVTVYLVRDPWNWYANGFARPGKYAVVSYSARMTGDLAHELGHTIGALDHYVGSAKGGCTTTTDVMCSGSIASPLSQQTLSEIKSYGW